MIKRITAAVLCVILVLICFTACSDVKSKESQKKSIVTTVFPVYDWVMNVLGEKESSFDVTLLLDSGVDMHSYQPTVDDIMKISDADLFIYIGGESDIWVQDAIKEAVNGDMVSLNLMEELGNRVRDEQTVSGMQSEEIENEENAKDEHIWLSLKNASVLTEKIGQTLKEIDGDSSDIYDANTLSYVKSLKELDKKYEDTVKTSDKNTLVFGDRFPFIYMTEDYSLEYYAAFPGCSAETEASFETVTFLADKVDELDLKSVIALDGSDQKIARTIIENTKTKDQSIVIMDSMQSVTGQDIENGENYLSVMEKNLEALKEALR